MAKKTELQQLLSWHEKGAAREQNRPVLTVAYATESALVSANGYSMHVTYGDYRAQADDNGFVYFKKSASSVDLKQARYVNWEVIIPDESAALFTASMNRAQLEQAIKIASVYARDSNDKIKLTFTADGVYIFGYSAERGDALTFVNVDYSTKPDADRTFAVNGSLLSNALSGFGETVTFHYRDWNHPLVIGEYGKQIAIVMPMTENRGISEDQPAPVKDDTLPRDGWQAPKTWKEIERETKKRLKKRHPSLYSKPKPTDEERKAERERKARIANVVTVSSIEERQQKRADGYRVIVETETGAIVDAETSVHKDKIALLPIVEQMHAETLYVKIDGGALVIGGQRFSQLHAWRFFVRDGETHIVHQHRYQNDAAWKIDDPTVIPSVINLKALRELLEDVHPRTKIVRVATAQPAYA